MDIGLPGKGMPTAGEMLEGLVEAHEALAAKMRDAAGYAGDKDDLVTEDMLVARITFHEKAAWMLRALMTAK